jgi:hypothetical protein
MDYDGQPQAKPDVTTRGIMVLGPRGCVAARYYVNVFPNLAASAPLGAGVSAPMLPAQGCPFLEHDGVPEIEPGAGAAAGLPVPAALR